MPRIQLSHFYTQLSVIVALVLCQGDHLLAQEWPDYTDHVNPDGGFHRGPGFYLCWWKILICLPVFLFWVKAADWVNVDLHRTGDQTKLDLDSWNPAICFSFFAGFIVLLCIPLFWIGYPLYLVGGMLPYLLYLGQRNKKVSKSERVLLPIHAKKTSEVAPLVLKQDEGVQIELTPGGDSPQRSQANLIAARQNPFFVQIKEFINDIISKRADRVQLEYSQQAVGVRYEVDGLWLNMPQRDRQSGDAILHGLKQLANLDPNDRRNRQGGSLAAANALKKVKLELTSSGTPTGERVMLKIIEQKKKKTMGILELGMLPDMLERLRPIINHPGFVLVSSMPGDGVSSGWMGVLDAADRVTRDFVGVCDRNYQDKIIENIEFREFDKTAGQTPLEELKNLALKLPQAFVVPDPCDGTTIDYMCEQIEKEEMFCVSQMAAKSAVEAVVRYLMLNPDRSRFAKHLKGVVYHRLFRRLCDRCKQPYQPPAQQQQQLGLTPDPKTVFYQQYQPPSPEELVDDKGRTIEPPPPCSTCGGIGYFGRIAVFELLEVNDPFRQAIVNKPNLNDLTAVARQTGHQTLQQEAIKLLVAGVTSVQEIQRVLKK
ncbi:MAG: ATPase, T2SS/T4P/T4SS family [Planctomycetota bacterium]|nr:ATPase, T2SS/T4P/T4SS family [Planctomycetota bacterium]